MKNPASRPEQPATPNSIHLDMSRLNRFLDEFDARAASSEDKPRRDFVRWPFRSESLPLTVIHPGGTSAVFHVAYRNLSSGGLGVLHSAFVHTGTRCVVNLPRIDGVVVATAGTIVRCSHLSGTIHELGIRFLKPIDPKQYVQLDPFANGFSLETVNPENLRGTVLYVEGSSLDQLLVRHYLRETQIRLIIVNTVEEGLAKAAEGVDLILCDFNVGDRHGSTFVSRAREAGICQPILIVTADTSAATRQQLMKAQATAYITKPIKQETLFRALAEYMLVDADAGGMASTLPDNHSNIGLLETFVEELKQHAKLLEKAMNDNDLHHTRIMCLQIAGSTPAMGFDRLAELARVAEKSVSSTMSIPESVVPLRTLISACQRTTSRRAA